MRAAGVMRAAILWPLDRKSTRLNSSHPSISYAVFCLKKKKIPPPRRPHPLPHTTVLAVPAAPTTDLERQRRYLAQHPTRTPPHAPFHPAPPRRPIRPH